MVQRTGANALHEAVWDLPLESDGPQITVRLMYHPHIMDF